MRLRCQPLVLIFQLLKILKQKTLASPPSPSPQGLNPGSVLGHMRC